VHLLEREAQLGALGEYAADARAGGGRLVLVSGEAGIGKSSLVETLERRLPEARWAWGRCDSLSTPRPLGPLFDLAPALGEPLVGLCRARSSRDVLFDATLESLGTVDAGGTDSSLIVLVVEDLHWADDATLDLLRFLGRRLRGRPVLVLATYRDDALGATDPLRAAVGELTALPSTRRIDLPRLSHRALEKLTAGTGVDARVLHDLTGGNPFFAVEVLRSPDSGLPASVLDVVLAKAAQLGESARSALDTAAVIGQRVPADLLLRVTGVAPREIDEMLTCGVLRSDAGAFLFRHELARLAVEQAIPPHRRAEAHRQVFTALCEDGAVDHARLAFHAEAAGQSAAALGFARSAAEQASALESHHEALAQYERAIAHADLLDRRERGELLDALAAEAALVDDAARALEARQAAITVWQELGDLRREGDSLTCLAVVLQSTARGAEATETSERALGLLEPLGDCRELARALCGVARDRMLNNQDDAAIAAARRAIGMAERLGLPDVSSNALSTLGASRDAVGEDGVPDLRQAVQLALAHGLGSEAGRGFTNLQAILKDSLRFDEADEVYAEGIDFCDRRDLAFWGWCLRRERLDVLVRTGRWGEADALSAEVLGSHLSVWNRLQALEVTAVLAARRGEPRAWELLDEALPAAVGIGEPQFVVPHRILRAEVRWLEGDLAAARAELGEVEPLAARVAPGARGPLLAWLRRLRGLQQASYGPVPSPYRAEVEGRIDDAVDEWDALGCPYDAALALAFSGEETHLHEALGRLERLGAGAAASAVRRRMRELGVRSLGTGPRAAARAHPAGLTPREQEVLGLLADSLSNEQIAGRLVLSVRTVDHHVSAILGKLGVRSRHEAADTARRTGLLADASES